jgi:hypothetical protein
LKSPGYFKSGSSKKANKLFATAALRQTNTPLLFSVPLEVQYY